MSEHATLQYLKALDQSKDGIPKGLLFEIMSEYGSSELIRDALQIYYGKFLGEKAARFITKCPPEFIKGNKIRDMLICGRNADIKALKCMSRIAAYLESIGGKMINRSRRDCTEMAFNVKDEVALLITVWEYDCDYSINFFTRERSSLSRKKFMSEYGDDLKKAAEPFSIGRTNEVALNKDDKKVESFYGHNGYDEISTDYGFLFRGE
jgi:hypothetical protein